MCGIAGFYQLKHNVFKDYSYKLLTGKLKNMRDSIKHRGPNDDEIFMEGFAVWLIPVYPFVILKVVPSL